MATTRKCDQLTVYHARNVLSPEENAAPPGPRTQENPEPGRGCKARLTVLGTAILRPEGASQQVPGQLCCEGRVGPTPAWILPANTHGGFSHSP